MGSKQKRRHHAARAGAKSGATKGAGGLLPGGWHQEQVSDEAMFFCFAWPPVHQQNILRSCLRMSLASRRSFMRIQGIQCLNRPLATAGIAGSSLLSGIQ